MDVTLAGSGVTYQPNDEQLAGVSLEFAAFDGEIGNGILPVPDTAAALTVATGRSARVNEIATRLTDGFLIDQDRSRGPQPASTARAYGFGVQDANALLGGFRVIRSRPAETDYARVMAFAALNGPTWDTTWVLNASTVMMPAKKYDADGGWGELVTDLVEFTGKTLWLHDLANGSGRCLHYHLLTNGHTCGLTISDVASAVNGVTVFAPIQPVRNRTSVDLRNDVMGRDQAGRTAVSRDSTSITAHDADGLQHQALIDFETTSQADLNVKTAAFLASQKDDLDTYSCAIGPLDATALARIRVGDLMTVTSSVMGLTASTQRISHMTLTVYTGQGIAAPGLWLATLELGAPIRRRARVKVGPAIAAIVPPPPPFDPTVCPYTTFDDMNRTNASAWGAASGGGGTWIGTALNFPTLVDSIAPTAGRMRLSSTSGGSNNVGEGEERITGPGPWSNPQWAMRTSVEVLDTDLSGWTVQAGPWLVAWSRPSQLLLVNANGFVATTSMLTTAFDGVGFVPITMWLVGSTLTAKVGSIQLSSTSSGAVGVADDLVMVIGGTAGFPTGLGGAEGRFGPVSFAPCVAFPSQGQPVAETIGTGDGATTAYATTYPYRVGSLQVYVNDLAEFQVTETDPTTGAFTFASAPFDPEVVRVRYQGA